PGAPRARAGSPDGRPAREDRGCGRSRRPPSGRRAASARGWWAGAPPRRRAGSRGACRDRRPPDAPGHRAPRPSPGPRRRAAPPLAGRGWRSARRGRRRGVRRRAARPAGRARGLHPRIHANQLTHGPGVQLAVEVDAASADHCTHLTDADVDALANSRTVATLLPGAEFSTRAAWPDARRLLDAGATVALSTDCNPGSSFTSSVPFCVALAVRDMGMTPDEAV